MKLIINTSNLSVGGGVQVALSFINELKSINDKNTYHIFYTKKISDQINKTSFSKKFVFYKITDSPSSLKNRKRILDELNQLENKINPDIVFSIFGPTFWTPKSIHIMGFALPWLINPESSAFNELSFIKRIKKNIENIYKSYYVKKNADYYITETDDTRSRLSKLHNINKNNIFVVGNTYSSNFDNISYHNFNLPEKKDNEFRLITISHNYPHKNLKIIKDVIPYLINENIKFKFILTIDKDTFEKLFSNLKEYVYNVEAISSNLCPSLYKEADALFLPTLLECFTASYPEAMKMKKPIITSELSFAKSICENSALYFNPLDPKDIAKKIINLANNHELQNDLIQAGETRLKTFETAKSRALNYLNICKRITNNEI